MCKYLIHKLANKYNGNPLIRSPMGQKNLAVLSEQAQIS